MRNLPRLLVVLLCSLPVLGQNIRYDQIASTTQGNGQQLPFLTLPGAVINFYTGCTVLPCGTKATTYQAATGTATCPSGQQVVWQLPLAQACTSQADIQGDFGGYFQPGAYQYTISLGPNTYGPYQFNVGGGGGGGSGGVTQIIPGTNVSCSPLVGGNCVGAVTINSSGAGGGVNPGTVNFLAFYSTTNTLNSTGALSLLTPTVALTDQLTFSGGAGATFQNQGQGGSYSIAASDTVQNNTANQINISTNESSLSSAANPSQIKISTVDTANTGGTGNANTANIVISALENAAAATTSNSGNVTISATNNSFGTGDGNVTITASGGTAGVNGGNINLTASGGGGGSILLNADPSAGSVHVTGLEFLSDATNFSVDATGDVGANGDIRTGGHLNSSALSPGCLAADISGNIVTQLPAQPCGSGAGGGIGGSGTTGFIPLYASSTTLTNSHLDEVTNPGFDTFTQDVIVSDVSGVGGSLVATEGTAPTAGSGVDALWADTASHRWKQNPNLTGSLIVPGIATPGTGGDHVAFATNGIDLVDVPLGAPSHTADSGAGTAGSLVVAFAGIVNDYAGYVNLTTGNSPAANAGVITITYGAPHSSGLKCSVAPASALAQALGANGLFVPQSTSTATAFVITVGSVALPANTTGYQWEWSCHQ